MQMCVFLVSVLYLKDNSYQDMLLKSEFISVDSDMYCKRQVHLLIYIDVQSANLNFLHLQS